MAIMQATLRLRAPVAAAPRSRHAAPFAARPVAAVPAAASTASTSSRQHQLQQDADASSASPSPRSAAMGPPVGRSSMHGPAAATALAVAVLLGPAGPSAQAAAETPYSLQNQIEYGVTARGTVRACPGNVNPNCVSTASVNSNYGPAWRAFETDAVEAAKALERAILGGFEQEEAKLLEAKSLPAGEYRAFTFKSATGPNPDVVEFLIKPEGVTNRGFAGDTEGVLVTYRGLAGNVRYLWPVQQVISDFGATKDRLSQIKDAVGWKIIGCELIECYDF